MKLVGRTLRCVMAGLALWGGAAMAQPGGGGPRPPEGGPGDRPGLFDRDAMRARLQRRLAELDKQRERLQRAMERLEKGEDAGDVAREMGGPSGRRPEGERPVREGPRRREGGPGSEGGPIPPGPMGGPGEGGAPAIDEREEIQSILRESLPELAQRLERLRQGRPEEAEAMMRRVGPRLRELIPLRRHDPEMFRVRVDEMRAGFAFMEAARMARQIRQPSHDQEPDVAAKREEAMKRLREAAANLHDARTKAHEGEVAAIERRLKELRDQIQGMHAEREKRINEAVERAMSGKAPAPDDSPPGTPGTPGAPGHPRPFEGE